MRSVQMVEVLKTLLVRSIVQKSFLFCKMLFVSVRSTQYIVDKTTRMRDIGHRFLHRVCLRIHISFAFFILCKLLVSLVES